MKLTCNDNIFLERKNTMANNSNGTVDILDDLLSGRKTVEQVRAELEGAQLYLRVGKNYKALKFAGFARITVDGNDIAVNTYDAGDKIDNHGAKVTAKPRAAKATGAKRK